MIDVQAGAERKLLEAASQHLGEQQELEQRAYLVMQQSRHWAEQEMAATGRQAAASEVDAAGKITTSE